MKKALPIFVVLAVVGAAGYYALRSGNLTSSEADAAALVGAEAPLFIQIPNIQASKERWSATTLAKIGEEPEIKAFLEKPLANLRNNAVFAENIAILQTLNAESAFLALAALEGNEPKLVGGFQFNGDENALHAAIEPAKQRMKAQYPAGASELEEYEGVTIESFKEQDFFVAFAHAANWFLVANDNALLKQTLDRLQGRDTPPALNTSEIYKTLRAKLPSTVESVAIVQPGTFIERFITMLEASGSSSSQQIETIRKIRGLAASTTFDGADLRDTLYVLGEFPVNDKPFTISALDIANADTLLLLASRLQTDGEIQLADPALDPTGMTVTLHKILQRLEAEGVDAKNLLQAFGPESALTLDWPTASPYPNLTASVDVKNREIADKAVKAFISEFGSGVNIAHTQEKEVDFYAVSLGGFIPVSPALALSNDRLYLSSSSPLLRQLIENPGAGADVLKQSEAYQLAAKKVAPPTDTYLYLDTKRFIERLYSTVRPMLGFMGASSNIDTTKLPTTEALTKHLTPIVLSNTMDKDGILASSVGPVTFNQFVVIGVSAAVLHNLKKQSEQ